MSELTACPSCRRLVRETEVRCPFCAMTRPRLVQRRRTNLGRASRSALLVSAAVALGGPVDACKKMLGLEPAAGVEVYGGPPPPVAVYGGPPVMPDAGVPVPPPEPDAGAQPDGSPRHDGGAKPKH